jgi:DNA invertase Pin-like site-specific DNA recombinase
MPIITRTTRTGRAIGYCRVSTDRQAESRLGIEAQQSAVSTCAARLGLPLAAIYVDNGSSGSLAFEDRPVLVEAVSALRRGDTLIVAKRDRIARDVVIAATIEKLVAKRGARIVSAAGEGTDRDDPSDVLMRRLLDSVSEHERLIIASRTKAALRAKRTRGERISRHIPYGFQLAGDGRTLQALDDEQAVLATIRERRAAGDSLRTIADHLNTTGVGTRCGGSWRFEFVRTLVRRLDASC